MLFSAGANFDNNDDYDNLRDLEKLELVARRQPKMITRNEFPGNFKIEKQDAAPLALSRHFDKNQFVFMLRPAKIFSFSSQNIPPFSVYALSFINILEARDKRFQQKAGD